MIARHMERIEREKNLRIIVRLRLVLTLLFGIGALGVGVYCGLGIAGVIEVNWLIFWAFLLGLIIGNTIGWGLLDDWEREQC